MAVATPLTGAGFRHHPAFSHPLGKAALTEGVVDLVSTGVGKVSRLKNIRAPPTLAASRVAS